MITGNIISSTTNVVISNEGGNEPGVEPSAVSIFRSQRLTELRSPSAASLRGSVRASFRSLGDQSVGSMRSLRQSLLTQEQCTSMYQLAACDGNDGEIMSTAETRPSMLLSSTTSTLLVTNYFACSYILLPVAFPTGGWILTCIIFALVSMQSYITSLFVLISCSRAEALNDNYHCKQGFLDPTTNNDDSSHQDPNNGENDKRYKPEDLDDNDDDAEEDPKINPDQKPKSVPQEEPDSFLCMIQERKYELSLLCKIFLSERWCYFFTFMAAFDLYAISLAFCTVFATTMNDLFTISVDAYGYELYIGIFVALAIPLSCTSILDQLPIQLLFLTARTLVIILMIGTLIGAYMDSSNNHNNFDNVSEANKSYPAVKYEELAVADFTKIFQVIQIAVFATAFQCFVPGVANVTTEKTEKLKNVFRNAVGMNFIINMVLGLLMFFFFGNDVPGASTLNWLQYNGNWFASFVSYYVVAFAAIDGLAIYPLISVCLGEILMGAFYGNKVHEAEKNWKIRALFRLLASAPQAVLALFVRDLGVVAAYGGIATLLSYTACPTVLYLASSRYMASRNIPKSSIYYKKSTFALDMTAYGLLISIVVVIIGVILEPILWASD